VIAFFIPEMTHQHLAKRRYKPPRPDLFLLFFIIPFPPSPNAYLWSLRW
jgi:hypothetical protein